MNKYRILEKEGYMRFNPCNIHISCREECDICKTEKYIPNYIIQEILTCYTDTTRVGTKIHIKETCEVKDLNVFDDLTEARKFKRSLELKDGIVIE